MNSYSLWSKKPRQSSMMIIDLSLDSDGEDECSSGNGTLEHGGSAKHTQFVKASNSVSDDRSRRHVDILHSTCKKQLKIGSSSINGTSNVTDEFSDLFDADDYTVLSQRYLMPRIRHNPELPGGMILRRQYRKRIIDAKVPLYHKLRVKVDALLKKNKHKDVYRLLCQLRDWELDPRRLPAIVQSNDDDVEVLHVTNDNDDPPYINCTNLDECITTDKVQQGPGSSPSTNLHSTDLTPVAKTCLSRWLSDHSENPYPTRGEKDTMMSLLGIDKGKLEGWFRRARKKLKKSHNATDIISSNFASLGRGSKSKLSENSRRISYGSEKLQHQIRYHPSTKKVTKAEMVVNLTHGDWVMFKCPEPDVQPSWIGRAVSRDEWNNACWCQNETANLQVLSQDVPIHRGEYAINVQWYTQSHFGSPLEYVLDAEHPFPCVNKFSTLVLAGFDMVQTVGSSVGIRVPRQRKVWSKDDEFGYARPTMNLQSRDGDWFRSDIGHVYRMSEGTREAGKVMCSSIT